MPKSIDLTTFENLKQSTGAEFIRELIDTFLADAPGLIKEMHYALASRDADSFRRAAHSLKSNAETFGAGQLAALARELEGMARANDLDIGGRLKALEKAFGAVASELKGLRA